MKVKVSYSPTLSEVNEVDFTSETTNRGEWMIGRSLDSDLVLDSPDVSRLHGKFFVRSSSYYFSDLGSRNGSIVNGKEAEKERPYLLKDGDIIRIADYVLVVEEVAPAFEQSETVFRIIDPSLFARPRSPENISSPNVVNPAPEVVSQTSAQEISQTSSELETPVVNAASPEVNEISEVVSTQQEDVIPDVEINTPQSVIQSATIVNNEAVNSVTPEVASEINPNVEEIETPAVVSEASEVSLTQSDNVIPTAEEIAVSENKIETYSEESAVAEPNEHEIADLEAAEYTFVQPRDIFSREVAPSESAVPEATYHEVELGRSVCDEQDANIQQQEFLSQAPQSESQVLQDVSNQVFDTSDAAVLEVDSSTPSETVIEAIEISSVPNDIIQPQEDVSEVLSNQYVDLSNRSTEEISEDVTVNDVPNLDEVESLETGESIAPELISQNLAEVSPAQATEPDEISSEIDESEPYKVIIDRKIVVIAHESKKSELAEFVVQHKEFFSQSFTITWPSVSEVLQQQAGITISQQTPAPTSGGYQTIASSVGLGEILAVIFLRDLLQPQVGQANEEALLRLCNINQVLLATNVPTAEALVYYIKHITE
ncbi:MAG: FHA domain-containing protein [Nostoc sp.]|uniref:FHA domain-containing protein n=1 Tax=Nostoc sp. TaxID=1180 RepID=UPI002FFCD3B7